jgi:hypothetical protein
MAEWHAAPCGGHIVDVMAEWWSSGPRSRRPAASAGASGPPEPQDLRIPDLSQAGAGGAESYLCPTG